MGAPAESLLQDAIAISKESISVAEMLKRLGLRIKERLGAEEIVMKDLYQKDVKVSQAEEVALNTKKPYLDNRLSGYSAFDLVNFFRQGYRSCLVLPIASERNWFGVLTFLASKEEAFDSSQLELLGITCSMLGYELDSKLEREKSLSMARYFDAAFEGSMPQFITDKEGRIVKANKSGLNLINLTPKEATGLELSRFFWIGKDGLERISKGGLTEARTASGKEYRASLKQINENLNHLLFYDITELKEVEAKATLVELSQEEAYMTLDSEMKITWIGGNTDMLKINRNSMIGRRLPSFIKEQEIGGMERRIRGIENSIYADYVRMGLDNGVEIEVNMKVSKINSGFGVVLSKNMTRYIDNLRKTTDDLIMLSPEFVIVTDELGYIRQANKSAEKLLKYTGGELAGVPISSICREPESQDRMNSALDLARSRDVVTDLFLNFSCKNGDQIPLMQNIKTVRDDENEIIGFMFIGKELSTKKLLEELQSKLEDVTKQAEKLKTESDLKTQFIFNVSHELKTPITNIKGYSKLLLGGSFGELTKEQIESVETIISESDRLMQLIQQILDVAKLSSGRIKLDIQKVDLNELKENPSIKSLGEMVTGKGLDFSFSVDYNVPVIDADPNRLIQVFVNLIVNAYKFTDKGSIRARAIRKGKSVKIEVEDTGIGISAEDKAKVFKRFYQISLSKRGLTKQEGSGTGLGLAIVREIVNLHGGRVGLVSAPGKGSTFWFTIPIHLKLRKKED